MYRLLIEDDEEIIANGLHEIFSSMKNLDLDAYKAYLGEEAIMWLNRTRIDIVPTDIRMPEIDGLQLLEEIHRNWPRCRVMLLTGYSNSSFNIDKSQFGQLGVSIRQEPTSLILSIMRI